MADEFEVPPELRKEGFSYEWKPVLIRGEDVASVVGATDDWLQGNWSVVTDKDGKFVDRLGMRLYVRSLDLTQSFYEQYAQRAYDQRDLCPDRTGGIGELADTPIKIQKLSDMKATGPHVGQETRIFWPSYDGFRGILCWLATYVVGDRHFLIRWWLGLTHQQMIEFSRINGFRKVSEYYSGQAKILSETKGFKVGGMAWTTSR